MKERRSTDRTQWAAQFAVASELCKRGYQVALTLGNQPITDLMVISPQHKSFRIDVKGQYRRSFWHAKRNKRQNALFYVFAYVPNGLPNQFFVMTQGQVNRAILTTWGKFTRRPIAAGDRTGVSWKFVEKYLDKWDVLPA